MQRLSSPTETVLSKKIIRKRIVLSFKDSPRKPLRRRPLVSPTADATSHGLSCLVCLVRRSSLLISIRVITPASILILNPSEDEKRRRQRAQISNMPSCHSCWRGRPRPCDITANCGIIWMKYFFPCSAPATSPLPLFGVIDNWTPSMKVKQFEIFWDKISSTGCKWSSLNAACVLKPLCLIHFWVNPFFSFYPLWGNKNWPLQYEW